MIYLYESAETDFRYNGKPLPASYDVTVSNTLNSEYYVMGKYPLDKDRVYKGIVEDRIIKVHTMDGLQPFRIVNVSKHELYVEFEAWPLFYADMRNKLVKPLNLKGVSGQTALNSFKNNLLIDTPFDFYSDITDNYDYHTQDENERENNPKQLYNALDIFKTIVNRWGGELWIRGYDIRVNKRIGRDTEAMLYEKKNITEFVDTTNIEGIVTRLHGKSEWQDERQEGEEEGQKHSIEVTVDSPLINDYSGVVFEKQFTNNDIRTEQELKNWLNLKFTTENIDKPQRTIEVGTNVIDETKIGFADTLILKYIKHDTDVRIKVVGYEYDGFSNELKHVVLGQPKRTSSSTIGNTITDLVNNVVEPVDRKTTIAMNSADGKSTVFHGTADPNTLNLNAKENDTYFRTNGSEKEIWRFTGTLWELIMDTSETTKNADAIEEQKKNIEEAKQTADEAVNQIDTAVSNAGFSSLTDLTASLDGRTTALTANVDSITGIVTDHQDRISTVEQTADGLQTTVASKASQTQVTQLSDLLSSTVEDVEGNATQISQLSDNINLRVTKGDVINQINISEEDILISSEKILLDGDVTINGTAWMDGAVIANASIDGAKIQDATIGSAKIANLDVGKISGNKAQLVEAGFNGINSFTHIDSEGIHMLGSGTYRRTYVTPTGFDLYNGSGATNKAGAIGYFKESSDSARADENYMRTTEGGKHFVGIGVNRSHNFVVGYNEYVTKPNGFDRALQVDGDTGLLRLYTPFTAKNSSIEMSLEARASHRGDVGSIGYYGGLEKRQQIIFGSSRLFVESGNSIEFYAQTGRHLLTLRETIMARKDIFMDGNEITGTSDARLKTNISNTRINSLEEIKNWNFVDFEWIDDEEQKGVQFGLLAQETSLVSEYDKENDLWSINMSKQVMVNSHAIQQVAFAEANTNKIASQALQATETNAQKIERLEKRIEELEGVA